MLIPTRKARRSRSRLPDTRLPDSLLNPRFQPEVRATIPWNMKLLLMLSIAANALGAAATAEWIQRQLPPDALVLETAEVRVGEGKSRMLVLWMDSPRSKVRRQGHHHLGCSEFLYGDHWLGPARLTLADLDRQKIVNTVEVRGEHVGGDHAERRFPIPFRVSNHFYFVPRTNAGKQGAPKILNLRDLTGEGIEGQFVLFEHQSCLTPLTAVLGYSVSTDTAVHFPIERSTPGTQSRKLMWVPYTFHRKPIRPGYWNFTDEPGHGADGWIHEEVKFDPARHIFIQHIKSTPYPGTRSQQSHRKMSK